MCKHNSRDAAVAANFSPEELKILNWGEEIRLNYSEILDLGNSESSSEWKEIDKPKNQGTSTFEYTYYDIPWSMYDDIPW